LDASGYIVSGATSQARGGTLSEQRLVYLTPKLAWHFSEWWRAEASYSYRWRDVDTFNEPVHVEYAHDHVDLLSAETGHLELEKLRKKGTFR
jgi:hypothetical protein